MYEQGSQFQPSAIEMVDGQTSPPQLLTEADLISLMEKHGIGTDKHTLTSRNRVFNVCLLPPKNKFTLTYEHVRNKKILMNPTNM